MTDIDPHRAVDFILTHAPRFAEAKANRVQLEEFRKSKKAILMSESPEKAANAREQYAYSHPEYIQLLDGLKEAVRAEEELRWKLIAAQMRVEIWRSTQANNRSVERTTR